MVINSKFNVGDDVYFIYLNQVKKSVVSSVHVSIFEHSIDVCYYVKDYSICLQENDLFEDLKDLFDYQSLLLKSIEKRLK